MEKQSDIIKIVIIAAFFSGGCFSLFSASLTAALAFISLFVLLWINKKILIPLSFPVFLILGVIAAYGVVGFFAVDKGMAFLGFVKMTAAAAFLLLACQITGESEKKSVWGIIPQLGGLSVLIGVGGIFLTFFTGESYFFQNDRLGVFIDYANTYALWLLLGLVIIAFQDKLKKSHYWLFALNVCGISLAVSRSLAIISIAALVLLLFLRPEKRKLISTMTAAGVIAGVAAFMVRGMQGNFGRLLETPGQAGEWLSRMSYYKDAISMIADNPLGMGYLGYWYSQPAYQTAFYDARFVHSSIVQYALDIGIIPAIALIALGIALIISKRTPLMEKIILVLVCGHSLIDIDLEFLLIFFVICFCIRPVTLRAVKSVKPAAAVISLMIISHFYFGATAYFADKGPANLALKLYPWHTEVLEYEMMSVATLKEAVPYAKKLIKRNKYTFLAMDTLARDSYSRGSIDEAVMFKIQSLSINRLFSRDYLELLEFCSAGYEKALHEGDTEAAEYYRQQIIAIPETMEQTERELSENAYKLKHKPDLQLPKQALDYIDNIERNDTLL